jgi:hypothetical protein
MWKIPFKILVVLHTASADPPNLSDLSVNISRCYSCNGWSKSESQLPILNILHTFRPCAAGDLIKELWCQFNNNTATGIICDTLDELTPCCMKGMFKKSGLRLQMASQDL